MMDKDKLIGLFWYGCMLLCLAFIAIVLIIDLAKRIIEAL